jgi:Ca-activated chloride channel family protein
MAERSKRRLGWAAGPAAVLTAVACLGLPASGRRADVVKLVFIYGSEKQEWVKDVTGAFNAAQFKTPGGKVIEVEATPLGSGESIDDILEGRRAAHLTSPASGAYIEIGNAKSQRRTKTDLVGPTKNLVRSPVVIAMWKPMAKALGWGKRPIGWSDVLELTSSDKGWGLYKKPHWGRFKFGHTHPEYSNSGLISILAEVYAAAGKTDSLTVADVRKAGPYLEKIERGVVHYGSSTGFFGKRMFANSPQYLNAAVLYENMVVESYLPPHKGKLGQDVVAIYPKEGTFWSDHPVGVVNRDWVTRDHRQAAKVYIDYLLQDEQQRKAIKYGFRPGVERIPLAAPLATEHGIDPKREPKRVMEVPSAEVMEEIIELWQGHKKRARLVLVIDTSGSMNLHQKLRNAKKGATELVSKLSERDSLSLLTFSDRWTWLDREKALDDAGKKDAREKIEDLLAEGETALYDSVAEAYDYLQSKPEPDKISAVVVLTDGADNKSELKLAELLKKIEFDPEKKPTRIFTICYGRSARKPNEEEAQLRKVLAKIAEATKAKAYVGDPKTIRKVFVDIATFF